MSHENNLDKISDRIGIKDISESQLFPRYFEIETIRACNAKCRMCTVNEWNNKKGSMKPELFDKIANEIGNYSNWVKTVCLSRNGEPLLDMDLENKIVKLKKLGIRWTSFSTNASLLTESRAVKLLNSRLDEINFSIDSLNKETFEKIRYGLNFESVMKNCEAFINLRNKISPKLRIRIRMVLQEENMHEEENFHRYWAPKLELHDQVYSKKMHTWGNQLTDTSHINKKDYSSEPCVSLWSTVVIHYDGFVPLCGCDFNNTHILGNVEKNSIKQIWNSEKFEEVRKLHAQGHRNDIKLCIGCNVWDTLDKRIYKDEK